MFTDAQVRLLRHKRMEGKTFEAAAAAAGMSVRSAYTWGRGPMPSEKRRGRQWRTHADQFAEVWEPEVVPLLRQDAEGILEATSVLAYLSERHPGKFGPGKLRTMQRRMSDWRALNGPGKEVFFQQEHVPGREAQVDFTHAGELGVVIGGAPFRHLLFEFVLSYSGWRFVQVAAGETFEELASGIQNALYALGGAPEVVRSDNLSAATHVLRRMKGRVLTARYAALLDHYQLRSTRINPGASHENGVAEQAHYRLKGALAQALVVRGSRDFSTREAYEAFIGKVVGEKNRAAPPRLEEERAALRPLPASPVPGYTVYRPVVRKWSTVRVANRNYSVPSNLIGRRVEVRQYAGTVEVYFKDRLVALAERARDDHDHQIDYRHIIWSLVRKPGAFARYKYREQMFPGASFRATYDRLRSWRGERADIEYLRVLHLAASTMESEVDKALKQLLAAGTPFDYAAVKSLAAPDRPEIPELAALHAPDLRVYDALLAGAAG